MPLLLYRRFTLTPASEFMSFGTVSLIADYTPISGARRSIDILCLMSSRYWAFRGYSISLTGHFAPRRRSCLFHLEPYGQLCAYMLIYRQALMY